MGADVFCVDQQGWWEYGEREFRAWELVTTSATAKRLSPVAKAQVSDSAKRKADRMQTGHGDPLMSISSLMAHLATVTLNRIILPSSLVLRS